MKILITGNLGFIGHNIGKVIKSYVGWDLAHARDIFDNEFEHEIEYADCVIHLAALTSVEHSFHQPHDTFRTNVLGTARVAELCSRYHKKLVFPSSAAIYFPDLSPYAKSKKMAEDIVVSMMKRNKFTVLRLYNVFGPHMNPDSGSIMYRFLHDPKIMVYGDGEQTRDFIHVRDVCSIIKSAIHNSWNEKIVDVGLGESFSVNYVAGLFAHFRGLKIKYMPPRREIRWSKADRTMLSMLYKEKLTTDMERDIKELCIHQ